MDFVLEVNLIQSTALAMPDEINQISIVVRPLALFVIHLQDVVVWPDNDHS